MPAGGDPARRDRVDAHRRPFERRRLGEVEHAGARRARVAHARHAVPHVGDDVDDRAAAAVFIHCVIALARHQEAAGEVVAHHRVPALGADRLRAARELAAGVVDQAIDAAVVLRAPRATVACTRLFLADVGGDVSSTLAAGSAISRFTASSFSSCAADESPRARRATPARARCSGRCPMPPPVTMATWPANRSRREDRSIGGIEGPGEAINQALAW